MLLFTIYPVAHTLWTSLRRVMILFPVSRLSGSPTTGRCSRAPSSRARSSTRCGCSSAAAGRISGLGVAHLLLADFRGRFLVRSVVILPWVVTGRDLGGTVGLDLPSLLGILNLLLYRRA